MDLLFLQQFMQLAVGPCCRFRFARNPANRHGRRVATGWRVVELGGGGTQSGMNELDHQVFQGRPLLSRTDFRFSEKLVGKINRSPHMHTNAQMRVCVNRGMEIGGRMKRTLNIELLTRNVERFPIYALLRFTVRGEGNCLHGQAIALCYRYEIATHPRCSRNGD